MRKFVVISLFFVSSYFNAQVKPVSIGLGIGNQYGVFGGARLALALSPKLESSISFGASPSQTESTVGITYYFKGMEQTMSFYDKRFDWPTAIAFGGNYYKKLFPGNNFPIDTWKEQEVGVSMLFVYKMKPKGLFGYTNTPKYDRRIGFGATYVLGRYVMPSLMFGADFKLPIKVKGYIL